MSIKNRLLVVIASFLFGISSLKAQVLENSHIRLEAGITASRLSNYGAESESLSSFRVGTTVSVPVYLSNFEISTGILFTQKGEHSKSHTDAINQTLRPTYIILPLDLSYRLDIDYSGCFYINAGPYFGWGIVGGSKNFDFNDAFADDGPLRRFQMGIGLSGVIEYNNFVGRVGGEIGMLSALKKELYAADQVPKNYQIYFTLGYRLFNW